MTDSCPPTAIRVGIAAPAVHTADRWRPESEVPPPLPPAPRVPSLEERDTEPPGREDVHQASLSLAPEALTAALGRLTASVEWAGRASEGARDAALHTADALQAHVAEERDWRASVDRRLGVLERSSVALPVAAVVLGAIALLLALVALVVAMGGHAAAPAAVAPTSLGAVILGALGAVLGVGHG